MKRSYSLLFGFLLILSLNACTDQAVSPKLLLGTWQSVTPVNNTSYSYYLHYQFRADNGFEFIRTVRNNSDGGLLGYGYIVTGSYALNDNNLTLTHNLVYQKGSSDIDYVDREDLEQSISDNEFTRIISFEESNNVLRFVPAEHSICSPSQDCNKGLIYQRLN